MKTLVSNFQLSTWDQKAAYMIGAGITLAIAAAIVLAIYNACTVGLHYHSGVI